MTSGTSKKTSILSESVPHKLVARAIAKETSYKAFVEEVADGQALLDMALAVE